MNHNSRDVLLVGSIGLSDADEVFRTVTSTLGERVKRIPDGETGWARSVWIQCQRPFFLGNPALEMLEPDSAHPGNFRSARVPSAGIYAHTRADFYPGRARLRAGVSAADVRFDNVGYADWAEESYTTFARLKQGGLIPIDTRFQVSLPDPSIVLDAMVWPDAVPAVGPAYSAAVVGEIERMTARIPTNELAIQWDCTQPVAYDSANTDGKRKMVESMARLSHVVPPAVELGYHLCYGDFEHRHAVQPRDLAVCVEMANGLTAAASRALTWVHMPVPRDRTDAAYVEPLRRLRLPSATRLYLGLVHQTDGLTGTRQRMEVASSVYSDFGIATECGLGRRAAPDIAGLLRIHARAAD